MSLWDTVIIALVIGSTVNALPLSTTTVGGLAALQSGTDAYPVQGGELTGLIQARSLLGGSSPAKSGAQ